MRGVHVDRGYPGEIVSPSRTPHPRPFRNPEHSRSRTRAPPHPATPRPLSRIPSPVRFFRRLSLARPNHPRACEHGTAESARSGCVRARVRPVRSSGLVCLSLANVGLARPLARAQAPGWSLNSNRKRTHVYTPCTGALHGALAERVTRMKRTARDRGPNF